MFFSDAGINGHYYTEELSYNDEYDSEYCQRPSFKKDKYYYHVSLFNVEDGDPNIVHETAEAYLISCIKGTFWVPKKLVYISTYEKDAAIKYWKVHKCFKRKYL